MPRNRRPTAGTLLRSLEPTHSQDAQEQPVFGWALPSSVVILGAGVKRQVRSSFDAGPRIATQSHVREVLPAFLRLAEAPHATIRAFVQRFGPLRISREPTDDGTFIDGDVEYTMSDDGFRWPWINELQWSDRPIITEPIESYRKYAGVAVATISSAVRARQGQSMLDDDLGTLRPFLSAPAQDQTPAVVVAEIVNRWMLAGSSRPMLVWNGRTPLVAWTGGLWGAIGTQLMARVLRDVGPIVCANCGATVRGRKRRPKANQLTWCTKPECVRAKYRESKAKRRALAAVT
jgi:hypothetical protein